MLKEREGMGKKGMTGATIVVIILAIAGFVIVIWVIVNNLNLTTSTQDEVCSLSALSRATTPAVLNSFIPLKCVTKKICITDGTGRCENYFQGEKDISYVIIPRITNWSSDKDVKAAARLVSQTNVEELYRCWDMMGRGKLDIYPRGILQRYGWTGAKAFCTVCSRVAVDNNVSARVLANVNFAEYEANTQVPGSSLTYLQTFTDKSATAFPSFQTEESLKNLAANADTTKISTIEGDTQTAFVFGQMVITTPGQALKNIGKDALFALGGSFVANPISTLGTVGKTFLSFSRAAVTLAVAAVVGVGTYGLATYNQQEAIAGYCGNFVSVEEGKAGCTAIQSIPYSIDKLNQICPNIEGLP